MKRLVIALGLALGLAIIAACLMPLLPGVAQALAAETASPSGSTVDLGWFATFASSYLLPALGSIVGGAIAYFAALLKRKWGIEIDAAQRDSLQTALTNAAGLLVHKGVTSLEGKTVNVGNPLVAAAVAYVENAAPDALKHFGLGPDDIAQKIAAKLAQITAPAAPDAPAVPAPSA